MSVLGNVTLQSLLLRALFNCDICSSHNGFGTTSFVS